jgi:hypothetical protein
MWFSNGYDFFLHKIESQLYIFLENIVLNHFQLKLCKGMELCTWLCLCPLCEWHFTIVLAINIVTDLEKSIASQAVNYLEF